jgi:NAD(P)-dependent dehydrogenase (short-subunit alcohol dehydrogenase family)
VVKQTVKTIESDVGKIYVVVNNAGGVSTRPFHMETMERFWYQVELNFKAVRTLISLGRHFDFTRLEIWIVGDADFRLCCLRIMYFLCTVSVKRASSSTLYVYSE